LEKPLLYRVCDKVRGGIADVATDITPPCVGLLVANTKSWDTH